jgi:nucleoside-diphosphate-sugar epimerase
MSTENVVLVAGAHGVSGRAAATRWAGVPDSNIFGLSRRDDPLPDGVHPVTVDLLNAEDTREKVASIPGITHVVFGAYIERSTAEEKSEVNVAILRNLLDAVESSSRTLQHVTFYQGGKAYGADLGPFKTPAREDDPRLMPPNFYYDQEDFLRARRKGAAWHWTALRPEAIYRALYQVTSADILAEASVWAGTHAAARDEIFNITNGDYFRWQHMWPRIARMFEMEIADPVPTPLAVYMRDKLKLWDRIVSEHKLRPIPYSQVASWRFGDFIFNSGFDNISSTIKARRAGFGECIDTEEMFQTFFEQIRKDRIIP